MFDIAFEDLNNKTGVIIDLVGYSGGKKKVLTTIDLHVDN